MATFNEGVMVISGPIQHKRGTAEALAASNYIPAAGEIVVATDTGEMRAGDGSHTWSELPSYDGTEIANNYNETSTGKALDAVKGKDLNDRLETVEGITGIDCGEITVDASDPNTDPNTTPEP